MDPYLLHSIAATATPPDSSREPHHGDESGPVELVVTADDLGVCAARNRGILYAMTRGAVTHTSLLANGPAALEGQQRGVRPSAPPARGAPKVAAAWRLQCDSGVGGNDTHTYSPCAGSTDAHRSAARAADRAIFSVRHPGISKKNRV